MQAGSWGIRTIRTVCNVQLKWPIFTLDVTWLLVDGSLELCYRQALNSLVPIYTCGRGSHCVRVSPTKHIVTGQALTCIAQCGSKQTMPQEGKKMGPLTPVIKMLFRFATLTFPITNFLSPKNLAWAFLLVLDEKGNETNTTKYPK